MVQLKIIIFDYCQEGLLSFFPSFLYPIDYASVYKFTLDLNSGLEMNVIIAVWVKKLCFSKDAIY